MKKVYHLSSCSTCQRIFKELSLDEVVFQDIKTDGITSNQLDALVEFSGSHESLFSRRAMKYKSMGLKDKTLSETDYRELILAEYTFLKRPIFLLDNQLFVGNSKKAVEKVKAYLHE